MTMCTGSGDAGTPEGAAGTEVILETRAAACVFDVRSGMLGPVRRLQAVRGVDLRLQRGEVLAIVGESGCGKTTLARMLMGIQPPTAGEVLLRGRPIQDQPIAQRARLIQAVFQDPYSSLNPRKTIGAIISLPLRVHALCPPSEVRDRTLTMMDLVGLPARMFDSYPNQLSGGQRQRVAIARALILRPEIVICDEPTSALDVSVQSQILNLLGDLRRELNLTYVLISHNLGVIEHMATEVAVMYLGRIVERGPGRDVFSNPRHPYTQALLASVMTIDPDAGLPAIDLGAVFPSAAAPPSGCGFHPRCPSALPVCCHVAPPQVQHGAAMIECHLYGPDHPPESPSFALQGRSA